MYEMLLIYDDIAEPDVLEDVMTVLSDTEWSVNLDTRTNITKKNKNIFELVHDTLVLFQDERH